MKSQAEKSQAFVELHKSSKCFVIPNPWDQGSAKLLEHLGFKALASTGAGYAFSLGKSDLSINAKDMLPYLRSICEATSLPVSADLQNGFGHSPREAAQTITEAASTGIVGGSIEDASGSSDAPIYDISLAKERIYAAAEAAKALAFKFMLTARAENYLYGRPSVKDTIARLQAYQEAGADVLFAPGIQAIEDIKAIVSSIDRPLNVIMGFQGVQLDMATLQELGVRRVSVGGSLARAAYGALVRAGTEVLNNGTFDYANDAFPGKELNAIFRDQL